MRVARIIVFDSGLGGLTVYRELQKQLASATYLYVADNAVFPYGDLNEEELVIRLLALFDELIVRERPDLCVIACNTASTIALAPLREHFEVPFVGTVPAIKTAAERTQSGVFSLLATPGTVKRQYTGDLIKNFAGDCEVTLLGAPCLAEMAEKFMRGHPVDLDQLAKTISPAFVEREGRRTDIIVLGCTHYPLLVEEMRKVAPWPVDFIDPSPAIARQSQVVLKGLSRLPGQCSRREEDNRLLYTGGGEIVDNMGGFLSRLNLHKIVHDPLIG